MLYGLRVNQCFLHAMACKIACNFIYMQSKITHKSGYNAEAKVLDVLAAAKAKASAPVEQPDAEPGAWSPGPRG